MANPPIKVEELFRKHCASCHGEDLRSGMGGSLVDGVWKNGGSDEEIRRSIVKGNPRMGMPGFGHALSDQEIRALIIYIREKEKAERYSKRSFPAADPDKVTHTDKASYRTEIVASGLHIPWSIAFLPDGRKLITERPGTLKVLDKEGNLTTVQGTPKVVHHGQGGLMDVAVHPDYEKNGWIYLVFSDGWKGSNGKPVAMTSLVRGKIRDGQWVDEQWLYRADNQFYTNAGVHFGSRIVFRDGYVFFIVGERGSLMRAQDLKVPYGKIYRLHDDGRVPEDNPFVGQPGVDWGTWTWGHRNPQGLAFDERNGDLYSTEHGPRGGDEFNLIQKGENYGWPIVTHGMNYDGTPITEHTEMEGIMSPVLHWTPSIAACGLAQYVGDAFPEWKDDFFAGGLASQELRRLRVKDRKVVEEEVILKGLGRVRDVKCGPDGYLYLVINDPDQVVRLVPAK